MPRNVIFLIVTHQTIQFCRQVFSVTRLLLHSAISILSLVNCI